MVSRALELYSLPVRFYAVSYEKKRKPSRMSREMLHISLIIVVQLLSHIQFFFFFSQNDCIFIQNIYMPKILAPKS